MIEEVRECLIVNQEIPKFQVWKMTKQAKFWSQQSQKKTHVRALNRKSQADKWGRGNYTNCNATGRGAAGKVLWNLAGFRNVNPQCLGLRKTPKPTTKKAINFQTQLPLISLLQVNLLINTQTQGAPSCSTDLKPTTALALNPCVVSEHGIELVHRTLRDLLAFSYVNSWCTLP